MPDRRGKAGAREKGVARRLESCAERAALRIDVRQESEVIARTPCGEKRTDRPCQRPPLSRRGLDPAQEDARAAFLERRGLLSQPARGVELLEGRLGVLLALRDIRLVERVHAEDSAGHRGGDLPLQHRGPEVEPVLERQDDPGRAGPRDPTPQGAAVPALLQDAADGDAISAGERRA